MTSFVDLMGSPAPVPSPSDERILNLPDDLLDLLPVGVCVCDPDGLIVRYNRAAAELWGRSPKLGDPAVRFCGSHRLYGENGDFIPRAVYPMSEVLVTGQRLDEQEIVIERPGGARIVTLANFAAIRDSSGRIAGAVNVFRKKPDQYFGDPPLNGKSLEGHRRHSDELLHALPVAIYTTDAAGHITFYNAAAAELWGIRPVLGVNKFCGAWKMYWPDGTPLSHDQCPMALALRDQRSIKGMEAIAERPDGTRVRFVAFPSPLFDTRGFLIGAINTLVDITERQDAERRAHESEIRYRDIAAAVEFSDDAILTKDLNGIITSWNHGATRLFGYAAEEVIGEPVTILIPEERLDEEPAILARIRRGERIDHYETVRQRKDGSKIDISLTVSPVKNPEGRIVGASKIARDITERRRAEEQQRLLLMEMDHRVKNLFALASGVVAISTPTATTPQELSVTVRSRLAALARAHALTLPTTSKDGERIEQSTTLYGLIRTILSPYEGQADANGTRITISGPDIQLSGGLVTSFALLLHEFATNAAKYGALSTPAGRIAINCSDTDGQFILTWQERDGPSIAGRPYSEGFGTMLGRATVRDQLQGEISRDWDAEGLTIRLSVSKSRLET
jgi:PAS domain S-box-containing protein